MDKNKLEFDKLYYKDKYFDDADTLITIYKKIESIVDIQNLYNVPRIRPKIAELKDLIIDADNLLSFIE